MKKSVSFKLIAIVFLSIFLLGTATTYFNYTHEIQQDNEQTYEKFGLAADILENDIQKWLTSRENEVVLISRDPLLQQYINSTDTANESEIAAKQRQYWLDMKKQFGTYEEIYLIDSNGRIMLSTDATRINTVRPVDNVIKMPLSTGSISFHDAYVSHSTNEPSIAFSIPVVNTKYTERITYSGVLVCRININEVIKPLLNSRMNLGETGEVILINKDRITLTELRSQPGSAMHHKLNTETGNKVSRGEEGIWQGIGYYGKEIFSVYRYIPKSEWGLIICQETDEIFAPSKAGMFRLMALNVVLAFFILVVLYNSMGRILKPLTAMAASAHSFSRGDFSKRLNVKTEDEIGTLGKSLNFMAQELSQYFKMQQNRQGIMEQFGSTIELNAMLNNSLTKICQNMEFQIGVVFLVDDDRQKLVRKAFYCPSELLLKQREELGVGEGLEGLALKTLQVQVMTDLPPDTVYTVDWLGGNIKPNTIAAVPLVFGKQAIGVICFAAIKAFTEQQLDELSDLRTLAGVAVNNALAHQRAVDLSYKLQNLNEQLMQQNEELNAQSEELQAQTEELQAQTEEMRAQTEELQSTSFELQVKNEELERLGLHKSKFMASLSHELRAPLNAVIGFSDVLLDKVVGQLNRDQEKYLQEINVSGQHLLNLIDDLLDLTKLEIAQVELNIAELDPAVPLEKALMMVQNEVQNKQLLVTNQIAEQSYKVLADDDKLRQIFLNLLTNAVKFTPKGGQITIFAASTANNMLAISVADNGIGIAKEFQEIIFEEFRQAGAISQNYGGTGLGLAITKNLVELHGGSITVESVEGEGAVFTFTLPISRGVSYLNKPADKTAILKRLTKATGGKKPVDTTILVIDDDSVVRNHLVGLLKNQGYKIITAENGQQGIELAANNKLDLIILDIVMPQVDGFAVMGALNKNKNRPPVIIYTSKNLTWAEKQRLEQ
jgi:signal transduction histidine kinase/CheY-like chemotaxis protein/HAMP domain-containing protein